MACNDFPGNYNFTIYQGASFAKTIYWESGDPLAPVDVTGYTADLKVKSGDNLVVALSTGSGIVMGTTDGKIQLNISGTDTGALTPVNAEYDLLLTSPTGFVTPLLAGMATVRKGISFE